MVYVLNINGQPLMPTENHGKVRVLLNNNKAKVIKRCPFTIQLLYETSNYTQSINLGVDAGSKHIGLSATTKDKVLFEADVELRNDIVNLLSDRKMYRQLRRKRKIRHRAPRFNNRKKGKKWIAPSIRQKIDTHLSIIQKIYKILPIYKIIVETAAFDIVKLKADLQGLSTPNGIDYQKGEQYGFWNVRQYVLWRDNHTCQCCKGKSKNKILNIHHIESRKTGGDAPNNLITLCEYCHTQYHKGNIQLPKSIKRDVSFKDATFMGIMRWAFYNKLKEIYPNVHMTYGYITKNTRIKYNLPKEHYIDARCISHNPEAKSNGIIYYYKKIRCHNRKIYKNTIFKNGIRKRHQARYIVKGFRLFDTVLLRGKEYYIHSRREKGQFVLKNLSGNLIEITPTKIKFVRTQNSFIVERRVII